MQLLEIFSKISGIRCGLVVLNKDDVPKDKYKSWVEKQKKKEIKPINWEDDSYFKVIETND